MQAVGHRLDTPVRESNTRNNPWLQSTQDQGGEFFTKASLTQSLMGRRWGKSGTWEFGPENILTFGTYLLCNSHARRYCLVLWYLKHSNSGPLSHKACPLGQRSPSFWPQGPVFPWMGGGNRRWSSGELPSLPGSLGTPALGGCIPKVTTSPQSSVLRKPSTS